jgi:hypothetical protein
MPQVSPLNSSKFIPGSVVQHLTGNAGGLVSPDNGQNIDILGVNNITVTGLPLSNTLDISITGTTEYAVQVGNALGALTSLPFGSAGQVLISSGNLGDPTWQSIGTIEPITDHAIPIGTITGSITSLPLGLTGQTLMGDTGADPFWTGSPSFSGTVTAGTGISVTTGDVDIVAGNLTLPATTATSGQIVVNGNSFIHSYGTSNTFIGKNSGNFTLTGTANNATGDGALSDLTGGNYCCAYGWESLGYATSASSSSAFGHKSLQFNQDGLYNCAFGSTALSLLVSGKENVVIGAASGNSYLTTESSNILIGAGVPGVTGESNTLRIGSATGTGDDEINASYIAGIYNTVVGATSGVVLADSTGQLGGLPAGTPGYVLTMGATAPAWVSPEGGMTWTVRGLSFQMVVSNGYFIGPNGLSVRCVATLPVTAAVGDVIEVVNTVSTGWQIAQNANQFISMGASSTTVGVGGSLSSTGMGDTVRLVCYIQDIGFWVVSSIGNIVGV